jgi:hypothetical protein
VLLEFGIEPVGHTSGGGVGEQLLVHVGGGVTIVVLQFPDWEVLVTLPLPVVTVTVLQLALI